MIIAISTIAETATFNNAGGDGKWDNPQNWDTGRVPNINDDAVIPEGHDVEGPSGKLTHVGSLTNAGTITLGTTDIHTSTIFTSQVTNTGTMNLNMNANFELTGLNNSGTMNVSSNTFSGSSGEPCSIINSGTIVGNEGEFNISNADIVSNIGSIDVTSVSAKDVDTFLNQPDGEITTLLEINVNANTFGNSGSMNSGSSISIISGFAYNNGVIHGTNEVAIFTLNDYLRKGGLSKITSQNGRVSLIGKKGDMTGYTAAGSSNKKQSILSENAGLLEIAVDTNWVVSDSTKMEGNIIRFIFDYLEFIVIDSLKSIYADSKIEFYGTSGSTLNFQSNYSPDIFWVEDGSIEIHSDNIIPPTQGLDFLFHPDPVTGPSDTTFTSTFIEGKRVSDSTGSSGVFKVLTKNNSTGHRTFNYEISSVLGWATTTTGTTQLQAPFHLDSLMIDYSIPWNGDTLVDTVMVILSIPGEYADTAYSYIRSYPGFTVGIEEPHMVADGLQLNVSPNPFSGKTSIKSNKDAQITITDINGRMIDKFSIMADCEQYWVPPTGVRSGLYLISVTDKVSVITQKVLYWGTDQ